jgi:hypothetical protein
MISQKDIQSFLGDRSFEDLKVGDEVEFPQSPGHREYIPYDWELDRRRVTMTNRNTGEQLTGTFRTKYCISDEVIMELNESEMRLHNYQTREECGIVFDDGTTPTKSLNDVDKEQGNTYDFTFDGHELYFAPVINIGACFIRKLTNKMLACTVCPPPPPSRYPAS